MNQLVEYLQSSPPLALAIALNILGVALKKSPLANWVIPILLPVLGAIAYPLITAIPKVGYDCPHPTILQGVYGFCIGAGAVGLHQLKQQWTSRKNDKGDTTFFEKKDQKKL